MIAARFKDPYSVLGVKNDASTSDIKKAYFDLVKKCHPDTNTDPEAKTKFIEIQNAYEILSDPKRKAMFDQYGATDDAAGQQDHGGGSGFGAGAAGFDPSEIFRNIFSGGGFGKGGGFDIFGNGSGNGNAFSQPDLDISVSVNLSFFEAARGASKTISFQRLETCSPCNGRGVSRGSKMTSCKSCRGTGQKTEAKGSFFFTSTCRSCGGMGQINPDPCGVCNGVGAVRKTATVQINIPSGVSGGEAIAVRREGNKISDSTGDLIVSFNIDKSDVFTRKKNDVYVTTSLPLYTALVGGAIVVPTIDGNVELKVSPGTQADDIKRMTGRGIYNANTREQGNQYVKFKVEIPRNLSKEQQELIRKCLGPSTTSRQQSTNTAEEKKNLRSEEESSSTDSSSSKKSTVSKWFDSLWKWLK